jgi:hypothetical protein
MGGTVTTVTWFVLTLVLVVLLFVAESRFTRAAPADADLWGALTQVVCGIWYLATDAWLASVLPFGFAVFLLWRWWRRRGRKVAERVAGVVRDIGHRLAVVNVPVTTMPQ